MAIPGTCNEPNRDIDMGDLRPAYEGPPLEVTTHPRFLLPPEYPAKLCECPTLAEYLERQQGGQQLASREWVLKTEQSRQERYETFLKKRAISGRAEPQFAERCTHRKSVPLMGNFQKLLAGRF